MAVQSSKLLGGFIAAFLGFEAPAAVAMVPTGTTTAWLALSDDAKADEAVDDAAEAATPNGGQRRWLKHRVVAGERLDDIAERYGVTRTEVVRWNKKQLGDKQWIFAGDELRVYARRFPPPRERVSYEVKFGDTWSKIATKFNVRPESLRDWNPDVPKKFRAGMKLTVWTNPLEPAPAAAEPGTIPGDEDSVAAPAVPEFRVRPGGMSVGRPNRGRLIRGVQLPESDLYKVRDPEVAWGSSHTVLQVQRAIAAFRTKSGYQGDVVIGAISKRNGGRFRPHSSHQSGRDIDIRLPKRLGASAKSDSSKDIDWRAAWQMVKAFVDTNEVEYIFLDYSRQRLLYRAAKAEGASDEEIERLIQYPRARGTNHGVVRHAEGHNVHIHVRIRCARDNSSCESY